MTAISTQPVDFSSISDPQAEREAAKYAQPIPSRELILQLLQHHPNPLSRSEIAQAFGLESDSDLEALRRRLRAMERDGQILYHHKHYLVVN
ncbi:MAG: ribonuclease, partial [Pseudomonadota bacterium]